MLIMDPFLPDVKPGIVVPVIRRVALALQSCNVVSVLFSTALTEIIWGRFVRLYCLVGNRVDTQL